MVRAALAGAGKTQKELAEHMGWTPQNLSGRLKNNSLTFDELSKALHFAGYEVSMSDANGTVGITHGDLITSKMQSL